MNTADIIRLESRVVGSISASLKINTLIQNGDTSMVLTARSAELSDKVMQYAKAQIEAATGSAHAKENGVATAKRVRLEILAHSKDGSALLEEVDTILRGQGVTIPAARVR